jgi:hypothetical protein
MVVLLLAERARQIHHIVKLRAALVQRAHLGINHTVYR